MYIKQYLLLMLISGITLNSQADNSGFPDRSIQPVIIYQQALDYLLGNNGKMRSEEKAAALFKSLAEQNWQSAQHMLGNMYFDGKGVEQNDLLAYKWLSIASRNNIKLAETVLQKRQLLRARLSQDHIQLVDKWIAEWQPYEEWVYLDTAR